jgi:hypothetical protein
MIRFILFLICCGLLNLNAQKVVISNLKNKVNTKGDTIDLHDGRVTQFGDQFYWYGTSYGNTSGFTRANKYHVATSPDLKSWSESKPLFENAPSGIYYRPHVIFHPVSKKYILWFNWYPRLWEGRFGVAISDSPTGPFKIVNEDVKVKNSNLNVGDFNLYVEGNDAYIAYNTISGHRLSIEKLSQDFLSSSMQNGGFITDGCEAGSIFKRGTTYYMLTDYTCCFCTQGSGIRVYTSDNPMSGYKYIDNINRLSATKDQSLIDDEKIPSAYVNVERAAGTNFPKIEIQSDKLVKYDEVRVTLFTGNRSGSCGDTVASFTHTPITTPTIKTSNLSKTRVDKSSIFQTINLQLEKPYSKKNIDIMIDSSYMYKNVQIVEIELYFQNRKVAIDPTNAVSLIYNLDNRYSRPIIPAQQTHVMPLETATGKQFIWMGDLWGSAPDNIKGHDIQYWAPMKFDQDGKILPMKWVDSWVYHPPLKK